MTSSSTKKQKPLHKDKRNTRQTKLDVQLNRFLFRLLGKALPGLMSWWALKRWSRTQRFAPSAREKRMQLRASECSLRINGKQIKVWRWGKGQKVLLIHGWNGRGLQLHRFIDPLLNAGYQVVSFDAPGHGQTDGQQTHLVEIRQTIEALAEQHGPFNAAIAHSFGVACLSAAINSGVTISNIIGISSPGGLSKLIQRYCAYMHIPAPTEQRLRERLKQRLGEELWQGFAESYPINRGVDRSLIIHDEQDQLVNWQESQQLSQCWPNAKFILTQGLGHRRILLDPATVGNVVEFIDTNVTCDSLDSDSTL